MASSGDGNWVVIEDVYVLRLFLNLLVPQLSPGMSCS